MREAWKAYITIPVLIATSQNSMPKKLYVLHSTSLSTFSTLVGHMKQITGLLLRDFVCFRIIKYLSPETRGFRYKSSLWKQCKIKVMVMKLLAGATRYCVDRCSIACGVYFEAFSMWLKRSWGADQPSSLSQNREVFWQSLCRVLI